MRRLLLALALLVAPVAAVPAQQKVPARPRLAAGDTNDARAYFDLGVDLLDRDPRASAGAFYWATRIDPGLAGAWYGRRVALLMADARFARYMSGDRRVHESKEILAIDSLQLRALALDPALFRQLDQRMLMYHIRESIMRDARMRGQQASPLEVDYWIRQWLLQADPETRGWMAYGQGNFAEALRLYEAAVKGSRDKAWLRSERGRIFLMTGRADSALAQLALALEDLRARDDKRLVVLYNSKAVLEHAVGRAQELRGDTAAARDAYGRALQEDLSYYPAHVALASLALAAGDTAAGLSAYEMAVQLRGDEPQLRTTYGYLLGSAAKLPEAVEQLGKAVELEPYYAVPHRWLGDIAARQQKPTEALAHYRKFLALASYAHPQRDEVEALARGLAASATLGARP